MLIRNELTLGEQYSKCGTECSKLHPWIVSPTKDQIAQYPTVAIA
jgi:hypothetical protein